MAYYTLRLTARRSHGTNNALYLIVVVVVVSVWIVLTSYMVDILLLSENLTVSRNEALSLALSSSGHTDIQTDSDI